MVISRSTEELSSGFMSVWSLPADSVGEPMLESAWGDRSVQIGGVFDGATAIIEGSNDGVTYRTLVDPRGNALSVIGAGLEQILESVRYTRPRVAGGTDLTAITFHLFGRRSTR